MGFLSRFFKATKAILPSPLTEEQLRLLAQLDPHRIFVENVRSLLHVSTVEARLILDTAVRQGVFAKRIGVLCPDGSIAASADKESDLPVDVPCWAEDDEGFPEETELPTNTLKKVVFYSLDETGRSSRYSSAS